MQSPGAPPATLSLSTAASEDSSAAPPIAGGSALCFTGRRQTTNLGVMYTKLRRKGNQEAAHHVARRRPRLGPVVAERVAAGIREPDLDVPVAEQDGVAGVADYRDRLTGCDTLAK